MAPVISINSQQPLLFEIAIKGMHINMFFLKKPTDLLYPKTLSAAFARGLQERSCRRGGAVPPILPADPARDVAVGGVSMFFLF